MARRTGSSNIQRGEQRHIENYNNPHRVTAEQIGVYSKDRMDSLVQTMIIEANSHADDKFGTLNDYLDDNLETLDGRLTTLDDLLNGEGGLSDQLDILDSQLTDLDTQLGQLDTQMTQLDQDLTTLEQGLSTLDTQINGEGGLNDQLSALDTQLNGTGGLADQLATTNQNLSDLDTAINGIGGLNDQIADLDTSLGTLDSQINDTGGLVDQLATTNQNLSDLDTALTTLDGQINDTGGLSDQLSTLDTQINGVGGLDEQLTALDTSLGALDTQINGAGGLDEQITTLDTSLGNLETLVSGTGGLEDSLNDLDIALYGADGNGGLNADLTELESKFPITSENIADSAITTAKFAQGISAPEIVDILPTSNNFDGRLVFLTTDKKLYRYDGTATTPHWTVAVDGNDIVANSITAGSIAVGAIGADQIAANAIIADKISTDAITADKIQANAITSAKIFAEAITASKIATNAITANKILAGEITADKFNTNEVVANTAFITALTTTELFADQLVANSAFITNITADTIFTNELITGRINVGTIAADSAFINALTAEQAFINNLTTSTLWTNSITANSAFVQTMYADTVLTSSLITDRIDVNTLSANTAFINNLTAQQGFIDNLITSTLWANTLTANSAFIDTLYSDTILTGSLIANRIDVDILGANTAFIGTLTAQQAFIDNLVTSNLWSNTITANSAFVQTLYSDTVLTDSLIANRISVAELTGRSAWFNEITSATGWFETVTATQLFADRIVSNEFFVDTLVASQVWADTVTANSGWFDQLTANEAFYNAIMANNLNLTGNINIGNSFKIGPTASPGSLTLLHSEGILISNYPSLTEFSNSAGIGINRSLGDLPSLNDIEIRFGIELGTSASEGKYHIYVKGYPDAGSQSNINLYTSYDNFLGSSYPNQRDHNIVVGHQGFDVIMIEVVNASNNPTTNRLSFTGNTNTDGHPESFPTNQIRFSQYSKYNYINSNGFFVRVAPLTIYSLGEGGGGSSSGSGVVTWDFVLDKPFSTIGTNLEVVSGALRVNSTKSSNWDTAYSHTSLNNNPHSVTKSQVGLGNVENTTLSTWNGSSNINTVGVLNSGSITSGFGSINIGTSSLTAGSANIANLSITGSNIFNISGSITLEGIVFDSNAIRGAGTNPIKLDDDVEITGTINYVNETNLQVEDKTITLNKNGTDASGIGAGIIIERPAGNESLVWDNNDGFLFSDKITATGGNSTEWNTAYTERRQWNGNSTNLNASTGRASLGLTGNSNTTHYHDSRYFTETEINNFFSGTTAKTGYNKSNWDTAYTERGSQIAGTGLSWNSSNLNVNANLSHVTGVGTLNSGSITSGFGNIDIGSSTLGAGVTNVSQLDIGTTGHGFDSIGNVSANNVTSDNAILAGSEIEYQNALSGNSKVKMSGTQEYFGVANFSDFQSVNSNIAFSRNNGDYIHSISAFTADSGGTHRLGISSRADLHFMAFGNNELILTDDSLRIVSGALELATTPVIDSSRNAFFEEGTFGGDLTAEANLFVDLDADILGTTTTDILDVATTSTFGGASTFEADIQSDGAVSRVSGWQGDVDGNWDFRSIFSDSLIVKAFTADVSQAFRGSRFLTKSFATIDQGFTVPAVSSGATLTVREVDGFTGLEVFEQNDFILLNIVNQSDGGLTVGEAWGEITSTITDNGDGTQSFTFTTRNVSVAGIVGESANEGSEALSFGSASSPKGFIHDTVLDNLGSPYSQVITWVTNPWDRDNWTVRTRTGNLAGIANASGYGFYGENQFLTGYSLIGDLTKADNYIEYTGGVLTVDGILKVQGSDVASESYADGVGTGLVTTYSLGSLADLAYKDTVDTAEIVDGAIETAKLGTTIIDGGHIKTTLLDVNSIIASGSIIVSGDNISDLSNDSDYQTGTDVSSAITTYDATLGALADKDTVNTTDIVDGAISLAKLGSTIVTGGYIKTDLINAGAIAVGDLSDGADYALKTYADQAEVDAITTSRNNVATNLGYTDYDDLVDEATAGNTIIVGGLIRTALVDADAVIANVASISHRIDVGSDNFMDGSDDSFQWGGGNGISYAGTGNVQIGTSVDIFGNLDVSTLPRVSDEGLEVLFRLDGDILESVNNISASWNGNEQYEKGISGQGVVLDGSSWISTSVNNEVDGLYATSGVEWTTSAWFKTTDETQDKTIIGKGGGTGGSTTFATWIDASGAVKVRLRGGGIYSKGSYNDGKWHQLVVTWDGTDATAYIDGEVGENVNVGTAVEQSNSFNIGSMASGNNTLMIGSVDEVRLYSRVLSYSEIKSLYVNPSGNSGGLISANTVRTGVLQSSNFTSISGNFTNQGTYFDLDNGNLYSEQFGIVGGSAYFKGDISGATGTFTNALSIGTGGTLTIGTGGTFSSDVLDFSKTSFELNAITTNSGIYMVSSAPSLFIGDGLNTGLSPEDSTTWNGFWTGILPGTSEYFTGFGTDVGSATGSYITWDETNGVKVQGQINATSGDLGSLDISGTLTLGAGGEIISSGLSLSSDGLDFSIPGTFGGSPTLSWSNIIGLYPVVDLQGGSQFAYHFYFQGENASPDYNGISWRFSSDGISLLTIDGSWGNNKVTVHGTLTSGNITASSLDISGDAKISGNILHNNGEIAVGLTENGATSLYHNNVKKLETMSTEVLVADRLRVDATQGSNSSLRLRGGTSGTSNWDVTFNGTNNDLDFIYGSTTHMTLRDYSGDLIITGDMTASDYDVTSDRRLKSDITDLLGTEFRNLAPKSFIKNDKLGFGYIAQDVQEVYPELVSTENEYLTLRQDNMIALNTAGLQFMDTEVDKLKRRIDVLEEQVRSLGGVV